MYLNASAPIEQKFFIVALLSINSQINLAVTAVCNLLIVSLRPVIHIKIKVLIDFEVTEAICLLIEWW